MANNKIPEGPKGEGLRKLKEEAPEVVARMGYTSIKKWWSCY